MWGDSSLIFVVFSKTISDIFLLLPETGLISMREHLERQSHSTTHLQISLTLLAFLFCQCFSIIIKPSEHSIVQQYDPTDPYENRLSRSYSHFDSKIAQKVISSSDTPYVGNYQHNFSYQVGERKKKKGPER